MTPRRLVAIAIGVAILGFLGVRYFAWLDPGHGCYLYLRPSLVGYDNTTIKRALDTLRHGSPEDYRKVCAHVATINPNPSCGGFGGGCFWHGEGQRGRASIDVSTEHGVIWTVGIIVHETCHAIQFHEGRPRGWNLEDQRLCRYVDRILEERCDAGDPQADPRVRGQSVIAIADPALRRAHAAAGCYVKGSRLIVMRPQPDGGERVVRERAEALKRAAAWSEAFWTGTGP